MSNSLFAAFTYEQIDTLKTALDTRIQRIDKMIQIFRDDVDSKVDPTWMISQYGKERVLIETLLAELRKA